MARTWKELFAPDVPPQADRDHFRWCDICCSWVNDYDIEEVAEHLEPDHKPPTWH
jgi:hypothetical protein